MKQLLLQYAQYNAWANKKLSETVGRLSHDQQHQQIPSSFDSIFKTMMHLLDVESIWWQRLKLSEQIDWPGRTFTGDINDLIQELLRNSSQWEYWVRNASDVALTHVFAYQNSKKEHFKQPVYEVLVHLFNHQSYHRGQLVTMLRQAGVEKIPATDFIVYCRTKK